MKIGKALLAALFLFSAGAFAQNERPLIRLTKQATSPMMVHSKTGLHPKDEKNLEGWLVLNGARFRNSEFPALANILREAYAEQHVPNESDADFTQLPGEPTEQDTHGRVVRGNAICPSPALCGQLTGEVMPFNLESSL